MTMEPIPVPINETCSGVRPSKVPTNCCNQESAATVIPNQTVLDLNAPFRVSMRDLLLPECIYNRCPLKITL